MTQRKHRKTKITMLGQQIDYSLIYYYVLDD
jgi:hypothetical protein